MSLQPKSALPLDSAARKDIPMARGVLDYFPAALAEVAALSRAGNDKHNPGEELHHARGKSMDHADCIMRHLVDRGTLDGDGYSHSVKVAWRALALLQEECEQLRGAPLPRAARLPAPAVVTRQHVCGRWDFVPDKHLCAACLTNQLQHAKENSYGKR